MSKFILFWLDGKKEVIKGKDIADAFSRAGYGGGALRALDFYDSAENEGLWKWDANRRSWERTIPSSQQHG